MVASQDQKVKAEAVVSNQGAGVGEDGGRICCSDDAVGAGVAHQPDEALGAGGEQHGGAAGLQVEDHGLGAFLPNRQF